MPICYLDNSATTPLCEGAVKAMQRVMDGCFGNPSSLHRLGIESEDELNIARSAVSCQLGCDKSEIYFTSGGTEANNIAVFGGVKAKKRRGNRIVISAVEHSSVLAPAKELADEGFDVVYVYPDSDGNISEEKIAAAINSDTIFVSMMRVNNESGAIFPIAGIRSILESKGADALVHCDCVQAFGKIPVRPSALNADLITISSHKIHGPKGAGALYIRKGVAIPPRTFGGLQERKVRPGTENTICIAGFGGAVKEFESNGDCERAEKLNKLLREELSNIEGIIINSPDNCLPYILNFSVPGVKSETMLHFLEADNIFVSSGSACSKGALSHVLEAQGLGKDRVDSALRVSFSRFNTADDVERLCDGIKKGISRFKRLNRGRR